MLSSLKPANGKFVLGPPVETAPPVVVFTGPADHPDPVQTAEAPKKKKKKPAAKAEGGEAQAKPAKKDQAASKPNKPAKHVKPKVSSASQ